MHESHTKQCWSELIIKMEKNALKSLTSNHSQKSFSHTKSLD